MDDLKNFYRATFKFRIEWQGRNGWVLSVWHTWTGDDQYFDPLIKPRLTFFEWFFEWFFLRDAEDSYYWPEIHGAPEGEQQSLKDYAEVWVQERIEEFKKRKAYSEPIHFEIKINV